MSERIPEKIMKMLDRNSGKKSNIEAIVDYLVGAEGSVVLTDLQEAMMKRMRKADDLLYSGHHTHKEVADIIAKMFNQSRTQSRTDIENAKFVFGSTRKANKPYLLALHTERIESAIVMAQRAGRHDLVPKLFDSYTKAARALPDDPDESNESTAIIFNLTQNNLTVLTDSGINSESARVIAQKRLAEKGIVIDLNALPDDQSS